MANRVAPGPELDFNLFLRLVEINLLFLTD